MRTVIALAAAVLVYPVASWLARLALTMVTLPLAGIIRDAQSRFTLRVLRVGSGIACGFAGFFAAGRITAWLDVPPSLVLACLVAAYLVFAHVPGLRRLSGGPQMGDEALSFVGEELGVVAGALVLLA